MKLLEAQYLAEYETKLNAVQARLDWYYSESYQESDIPKSLILEFYRLLNKVNELKNELKTAGRL